MKKLLPVLVVLFLVPQIALAAWWNPLSWFGGWGFLHKKDDSTHVLENRIQELEKRLENTATSTASSTSGTSKLEVKSNLKTVEEPSYNSLKSVDIQIKNSDVLIPEGQSISIEDLIKKYSDFYTQVAQIKKGLNQFSDLSTEHDYYEYIDGLQISINADLGYLYGIKSYKTIPYGVESLYVNKLNKLMNDYKVESNRYPVEKSQNELSSAKLNVVNYIKENKDVLYLSSVHIQAASLLYLFDQLSGTKYGVDFENKKTQQETIEFANRFLIDQGSF